MKRLSAKTSLLLIVFILFFVPVITSSLLDFEKKIENEIISQRAQDELLAQKEAQEAQEKIYLMGKFDPAKREDFSPVPDEYNITGYKTYLRTETLDAFLKMADAAKKDEINLKIASATRNFGAQKEIWANKWYGFVLVDGKKLNESYPNFLDRFKKILEYSAIPGMSRHHWGTDIDINDANPQYFNTPEGAKVYAWLTKNAPAFGFCEPYTPKGTIRPTGYFEEKWHWSYLPIARPLAQEYKNLIREEDVKGFPGDEYTFGQDMINNYVIGINPDCI